MQRRSALRAAGSEPKLELVPPRIPQHPEVGQSGYHVTYADVAGDGFF